MPDTPTELVTGLVAEIITKGPSKWQAVVKESAEQTYGKKLWHDDADQNAAITALLGQTATFEIRPSTYEREGKPVTSYWIVAVNPGAPPPTEPPGAEEALQGVAQEATGATESAPPVPSEVSTTPAVMPSTPTTTRDSFGDPTRASIERQQALINATNFHKGRPNSTFEDVLADAEKADQFLARVVPF